MKNNGKGNIDAGNSEYIRQSRRLGFPNKQENRQDFGDLYAEREEKMNIFEQRARLLCDTYAIRMRCLCNTPEI